MKCDCPAEPGQLRIGASQNPFHAIAFPCDDPVMGQAIFRRRLAKWAIMLSLASPAAISGAQTLPATVGETLSGHSLVLAQAMHGHASILLMGFSKDGGMRCGDWVKAIHDDAALNGVAVYQASMLEGAPALLRPAIKNAMRKGLPPAEQDAFVVLTQDQKLWRSYFDVSTDKDPYVVLMDAVGQVRWHGHGDAKFLEPLLGPALR